MTDWRKAQGLDEYAAYIEQRDRELTRQERQRMASEPRSAFDTALFASKQAPQPLRLAPGDLTRLLEEEEQGLVEIVREDGQIVAIRRNKTNKEEQQ